MTPIEWNVDTRGKSRGMPKDIGISRPSFFAILSRISRAALLVKVTQRIEVGAIPISWIIDRLALWGCVFFLNQPLRGWGKGHQWSGNARSCSAIQHATILSKKNLCHCGRAWKNIFLAIIHLFSLHNSCFYALWPPTTAHQSSRPSQVWIFKTSGWSCKTWTCRRYPRSCLWFCYACEKCSDRVSYGSAYSHYNTIW
jgi:hypothetical protein